MKTLLLFILLACKAPPQPANELQRTFAIAYISNKVARLSLPETAQVLMFVRGVYIGHNVSLQPPNTELMYNL